MIYNFPGSLARKISIILISIMISSFFITAASAIDIEISPANMPVSGDIGDIVFGTITVENLENVSIVVNFSYDAGQGITIFPESLNIPALSSADVGMVFELQENISSGNISISYCCSNIVNITLIIDAEPVDNDSDDPLLSPAPVDIFPSNPVSGSSIAIFFTGEYKGRAAKGFLYCNGYLYPVIIEDGFGIVSLDIDAHGTATLYLFGSSVAEMDSIKTFDVQRGSGKYLQLISQKDVTIGSDVAIVLKMGEDFIGNVPITVTNPNDEDETFITDNLGQIEFNAEELGKWRLIATFEGQTATSTVNADYGYLAIGVVDEEFKVGDLITVVTEPEAKVKVFIDDVFQNEYIASMDGFISLVLSDGGRYTLESTLGYTRGKFMFTLPGKAEINLLDQKTRMPLTQFEQGSRYIVEVKDSAGNFITEVESVWISNPMGTTEILRIENGQGVWMPYMTGSFILSVDDTSSSSGTNKYLLIKPPGSNIGLDTSIIIILMFFIVTFIILFLYSKKRKVPFKLIFSSLFKKQKRPTLPID